MKVAIKVPAAGESVSEATVAQIMKESGSQVNEGDEILELETDKVNQVVYAPATGKITLTVKVDDVVKPDQEIGSVDSEAKGEEQAAKPEPKQEPKPEPAPESSPEPKPEPETPKVEEPARIMPEQSLKEERPQPRSPAPSTPPPAVSAPKVEGDVTRKRMSGLRRTIAERLVTVKNQTAMLTTFNELDMTAIMDFRKKEQEKFTKKYGVKLGFMSFFVKAAIAALKEYPEVNSIIEGDEIVTFNSYDIGVAVSTEKGLLVPVLKGGDQKSFADVEKEIASFAEKARSGQISIDDLKGGSFTITNGGIFGSMLSTPILNPPQSAILGMHNIVKRPVVVNDEILVRPIMYLALSYDHRIIDGKEAVQFLVHMKNSLEDPARLLL